MGLCSCCSRRTPPPQDESKAGHGICALFFRTLIFAVCAFFFGVQAFLLIDQYFAYPTVIKTSLNSSDMVALPGITVCFPIKFEGNKINSANEVFKMNFNGAGAVKCNLMKAPVSMEEGHGDLAFAPSQIACEDVSAPVESINYGYGQKCKTYFSQQKGKNPMDFTVRKKNSIVGGNGGDIVDLEIEFPNDQFLQPNLNQQQQPGPNPAMMGYETRAALLMLHSPFEMPDWSEKVSKIKPAMEYVISFSKTTEKRVPPPFGKCSHFDDGGSAIRSNPDCVDLCLLNLFRQGCRCLPANLNVRRELLYSGDRFCDDKRCFSLASTEAKGCNELPQCMPNCAQETYQFSAEVTPVMAPTIYYNNRRPGRPGLGDVTSLVSGAGKAFITLRKASSPDVIYEHTPKFDYREFLFQVATLACVWMGMSVFAVLWKPIYFVGRILARCFCLGKTKTIDDGGGGGVVDVPDKPMVPILEN